MVEPARENPPPCFGDPKLWDPKASECAGGMDPAFTNEHGSHVREKCVFFESCGTRVQASRMEPARSLLDPKSLLKNTPPLLGPARPPQQSQPSQTSQFVERFMTSIASQPIQQVQQNYMNQPPRAIHLPPQQVPQGVPIAGYQAMMPVNYQMPGYLSVPEQRHPAESFWTFLGRTIFRSMGKSLGHSIAHLFDTVPLGTPPPPGVNVNHSGGG